MHCFFNITSLWYGYVFEKWYENVWNIGLVTQEKCGDDASDPEWDAEMLLWRRTITVWVRNFLVNISSAKYRYFVWAHHSGKFQNISFHFFYFYFLIFHVLFLFFWTLCFLSEFLRNVLECFVFFSECFGFFRFFWWEFVGILFRGIFKNFAAV
jgi:hypothetical protein